MFVREQVGGWVCTLVRSVHRVYCMRSPYVSSLSQVEGSQLRLLTLGGGSVELSIEGSRRKGMVERCFNNVPAVFYVSNASWRGIEYTY